MASRLGGVLYMVGWVFAAIALLFLFAVIREKSFGDYVMIFITAVVPWAIGWALRYILSGETDPFRLL